MGLTTQKSIFQSDAWPSPHQNYDITAIATRSSKTSKAVTIKVTATIGFNKANGIVNESKYGYSVVFKATRGSDSKSSTINPSGTTWSMTSTSASRLNSNGSTMTGCPQIKSKTITFEQSSWTDGNSRDIDVSLVYNGKDRLNDTITLSMPDYSSSSGGGGSGTTIEENTVSISIVPSTITSGERAKLTISSTVGNNNSIIGYRIFANDSILKMDTSDKIHYISPTNTTKYRVTAVSGQGSSYNKTSDEVTLTVIPVPMITKAYIQPTSVSNLGGGEVTLYAETNVKDLQGHSNSFKYYINGNYGGADWSSTRIEVNSGDTIIVKAYDGINGNESNNSKSITVGGYTPVKIDSITITPKIIKNNISSPDLVNIIDNGRVAYSGPVQNIRWYYKQSPTASDLEKASLNDLGISSANFSNLDMTQKVNKGYYYQFYVSITGSNNDTAISSFSDIYQIPKPPGSPNFTKIITKSNPYNGYNEIIKDNKKYYGSGLFLQWNNPTITDSQVDFDIIEIIYQSKSSTATEYNSIQTAQFQYHNLLDNEIEYEYSNNVPYTAINPTGATGSGGGADLDVDSLYETRIGIRITDILGQYTDTWYTAETFIKAQAPDFGGNLTLKPSEFRPFTCNVDGKMSFTSTVARSAAQDKLFYSIDCYVNERRATIKILDSIPISTLEMDTQSTGYILYQDDNIIAKKENGTTIAYEVNNGYFKNKLLAETKLKSSKEGENIYFNDDFNEVVYQIYVKDDFDASTRHYSTENKSIKFIEAPTLNNNNYLSIGINRYNKSLNPFNDNSIILINSSSSNSERIVNPGEDIIFRFKQAKDYNGADYNSTMRGDVTNYNVYVSRNDSIVTTDYDKLNYTLLKTFSIDELKKALPSNSNDEYYYFSYNIKNYNESKFVTFKIEAVDSKYKVSEPIYSDTYLVPCRAVPMDFYLSNVRLEKNIDEKYYIQFKAKLNDFGGSTFINDTYGYSKPLEQFSYPNYERQFSVNSNNFNTKGYIIFEGCLDGDFSNKGTTTIIKDMGNGETQSYTYNNYFSEKITISLGDKHYTDKIEQLYDTKLLSDEWTNGIKNNILGKIFFKATFKISYGFLNLEETEDNFDLRYLVVTSVSAPYSYYQDAPTVSYRNHQVGINTKDFGVDSEGGQKEVLIVQDNGSYNLVVFKGAEQKIVLNLTERTLSATTENNGEIIINFNNGTIDGAIIKSAEW